MYQNQQLIIDGFKEQLQTLKTQHIGDNVSLAESGTSIIQGLKHVGLDEDTEAVMSQMLIDALKS